jgi:hypothetical protein
LHGKSPPRHSSQKRGGTSQKVQPQRKRCDLSRRKTSPNVGYSFPLPISTISCDAHSSISSKNSYDEIVKEHQVVYVAGGAAQNAARGAAVCSTFAFPILVLLISFSPPVRAASKLRGLHRLRRRRRSRPTTQGGKQKGGSRRSVSR